MGWISRTASWFGLSASASNNPAEDRFYETVPTKTPAGIKVTADSALKCAAVFRCVTIWADILSTLPFGIYKLRQDGVVDGGMDPDPNHPVHDIIALHPNLRQTPAEFWGMMIFHAALRGRAFAEIVPGPRGAVHRLEPIHPDRVDAPELLPDGTLRFKVRDPKTGSSRTLLQEELLRIPGLTSDGVDGLRTVELASDAIALLKAADEYAGRVFSQNLNMGGFFSHPGKLSPTAVERLRSRLMQSFAGAANFFKPMILQEGMKFEQASMKARDAQLLDSRLASVREIANYFGGVPLHLLGIDDQTNRSTVEEQSLNFVRYGVRPWCEKLEQSIRRDLIIAPRRYVAVINIDSLERGNMAARAEYFSKALGSGGSPPWMTQNEVRVAEGYNKATEKHASELAQGTNPSQQQPAQPTAELTPPETGPYSGEATVMRGAALVRKEVAALRRLHIRHAADPAAFRKAVNAFYGGFSSQVAEKLDVTKDEARAWCRNRADRINSASDVASVIEDFEAEIATDETDLIDRISGLVKAEMSDAKEAIGAIVRQEMTNGQSAVVAAALDGVQDIALAAMTHREQPSTVIHVAPAKTKRTIKTRRNATGDLLAEVTETATKKTIRTRRDGDGLIVAEVSDEGDEDAAVTDGHPEHAREPVLTPH